MNYIIINTCNILMWGNIFYYVHQKYAITDHVRRLTEGWVDNYIMFHTRSGILISYY